MPCARTRPIQDHWGTNRFFVPVKKFGSDRNLRSMQTEKLTWQHDGMSIELSADWSGQGPLVLLLPALSSISTRREMQVARRRSPFFTLALIREYSNDSFS